MIGDAKNILVVDNFSSEQMAFFLRFAAVFAYPGSEGSKEFAVTLSNESIIKLLPIISFYECDGLWNQLISFICSKPELILLVEAEKCHQKSIDWNEKVLDAVIDEILSKPSVTEKVDVKKGFLRHAERGDLTTGMVVLPGKTDLLNRLSSVTVSRIMQHVMTYNINLKSSRKSNQLENNRW
jgi:hypothetical protein